MGIGLFFKKAWKFACDQWLFFLAAIGAIASLLLVKRTDMSEELARSKKESDAARREKDERQRELIETFQEKMREIDRDIQEQNGEITSDKEERIREAVDTLKGDLTEEELVSFLRESAPSFKHIPPQSFGEIDEPN